MDHHVVDPDWLLNKLPVELKLEIINTTCLSQMRKAYGTDDLETIASRIGASLYSETIWEMKALWLDTLLDIGVRIPDLPTCYPDEYGRTPFHCATQAQDTNLIRRLVRLGYDINAVDSDGNTAIYQVACWIGADRRPHFDCLSILRTLCKEGASVNRLNHQFPWSPTTILQCLINYQGKHDDCMTAFKLLLKYGASTSGALHVLGYDVNYRSYLPYLPVLLDAGADIEELCENMTPLTAAARLKNPDVVQALINAGADVNGDGSRILPLFTAIEPLGSHRAYAPTTAATLKVLCDAGADVNRVHNGYHILSFAMTSSGYSTEHNSSWDTVPHVVETLCKGGADVNFRREGRDLHLNIGGNTPLHVATLPSIGRLEYRGPTDAPAECIEILIAYGANVDAQNDDGQTPLHTAVKRSNLACAKVLVEHGARTDLKDNDGKTALVLAQEMGGENEEMIAFLAEQQGAPVS